MSVLLYNHEKELSNSFKYLENEQSSSMFG